jgi:hypothetical protein
MSAWKMNISQLNQERTPGVGKSAIMTAGLTIVVILASLLTSIRQNGDIIGLNAGFVGNYQTIRGKLGYIGKLG